MNRCSHSPQAHGCGGWNGVGIWANEQAKKAVYCGNSSSQESFGYRPLGHSLKCYMWTDSVHRRRDRSLGLCLELCSQHPAPTEQRIAALYLIVSDPQISICYPLFRLSWTSSVTPTAVCLLMWLDVSFPFQCPDARPQIADG